MPANPDRVREILSWYGSDNPGDPGEPLPHPHARPPGRHRQARHPAGRPGLRARAGAQLRRPTRRPTTRATTSSSPSTPAATPTRAPLGFIEAGAARLRRQIPLILKANNADCLYGEHRPDPGGHRSVDDALRLGCAAIGFTIYPGSGARNDMYEQLRELAAEAKAAGLVVVVWSYPRGCDLTKEGETALDVVAYAAQIAAQLGAHIIKVKPPTAHVEHEAAKKAMDKSGLKTETLADRVRHVVQSAFDGRRIVIFSGGEAKGTEDVLEENRQTALGGGFGTIIGRNSFQRPHDEAVELLHKVMDIHATTWPAS